ncbi:MAG: hypothetical protein KDD66_06295 [Bdellovibrionales bacterium]|nr:hypothetical protein [Bdellovibrionales bacterium]
MDVMQKAKEELIGRMVLPALRYCLRSGVAYKRLNEIIKSVLIQLAQEEINDSGEEVTLSRLSVMTGINRRDVTRIYREGSKLADHEPDLMQRVLNRWEQHPDFRTKGGRPKVLTYKSEDSEFNTLVRMVSKDMNPATMLFQLERLGMVKRTRFGLSLLKSPVISFKKDPKRSLDLLARNTVSLIESHEENLFETHEVRNLNIRTEYDNIVKADIPAIRAWLLEQGQIFHRRVREYLSGFDKDVSPNLDGDGGGKVVVAAFSWTDAVEVNTTDEAVGER